MNKGREVILVVDDEPVNIEIVELALEGDYKLEIARSGEEALEKIKLMAPAVVLLDIMMPGVDGYDVCSEIRNDERLNLTKVVLVSGKAMLEERLKGYDVGANDYITKPFEEEELQAKVKIFIDLYQAEKSLSKMNSSLEHEIKVRTEELFKAEKMAFIGMHSAEIVHDLRNPLCIIQAYANRIKHDDPQCDEFGKYIRDAGDKLGTIITSILNTTTTNYNDKREDVDINKIIHSELELLKVDDNFSNKVKTSLNLSEVPSLRGFPAHFHQIFGNLIKNAIEAMFESESKLLTINSAIIGERIYVKISDTGPGIADEILEDIFKPLFTTKSRDGEDGKPIGTGLGLASCNRMIEGYGGEISVESEVGTGASFTVTFPLNELEDELEAS